MIPIIFINSRSVPFVDMIMEGKKLYETRTRNVLKSAFEYGNRFLIAETGNGKPVVRCSATIEAMHTLYTEEAWNRYRNLHAVPAGSEFDWKPDTKKKVLYHLTDVQPVEPFVPEGKRHGRTWMECSNCPDKNFTELYYKMY